MILPEDLKLYKAANSPDDDTSLTGGAISATEMIGTLGELIPTMVYAEDDDVVWYYKFFYKNDSSAGTFSSPKFWVDNLITPITPGAYLRFVSSSTADTSSYKLRIYGVALDDSPTYVDVTLDGVTAKFTPTGLNAIYKIEYLTYANTLAYPVGDISLWESDGDLHTSIGKIPSGCDFASGEIAFALETDDGATPAVALNQEGTATTRLDEPTQITAWSTANTAETALSGVDIPIGTAQGIWLRITGHAGTLPTLQNRLRLRSSGYSPA